MIKLTLSLKRKGGLPSKIKTILGYVLTKTRTTPKTISYEVTVLKYKEIKEIISNIKNTCRVYNYEIDCIQVIANEKKTTTLVTINNNDMIVVNIVIPETIQKNTKSYIIKHNSFKLSYATNDEDSYLFNVNPTTPVKDETYLWLPYKDYKALKKLLKAFDFSLRKDKQQNDT